MGAYIVNGGHKLNGSITVSGAKNSSLPIIAASILNGGLNEIHNIPNLKDVNVMINLLEILGAKVNKSNNSVQINTKYINTSKIPESLTRQMRSSIFLMGPMLARFNKVQISHPGGCEIGPRPIDLHLKGLRQLGVNIREENGFINACSKSLYGTEIHLDYPSVGATENIMMAAVKAEGTTIIRNSAKEPEIVDLQTLLNKMGASIRGAGTDTIRIHGVKKLKNNIEHTVIPDRIVAGTYMIACAMTEGHVEIKNVVLEHMDAIVAKLKESGCIIKNKNEDVEIIGNKSIKPIGVLRTMPYPGFPTDMQAIMMAFMTKSNGSSIMTETVFENRFKHVDELKKMGSDIKINSNSAYIKGVKELIGTTVYATDLRAGAALILAGLAATGKTTIKGSEHVERGYENIETNLQKLGAEIKKNN